MQTNKQAIQKIIDAFNQNDVALLREAMHPDGEWNMVGEFHEKGIDKIVSFFEKNRDMKMVESTIDHFFIDGDFGAVDGFARCQPPSGPEFRFRYCDIYELKDGKILKLISYTVDEK